MSPDEQFISFCSDSATTIRRSNLVDWWAAWLCGVERGEFGGPCPFGPNTLPQYLMEDQVPENIWLTNYVEDFAETPFYWICGLQSFIPIKNMGDYDGGEPHTNAALTNLDEIRVDENQVNWCYPTMVERATFLMDYLNSISPIAAKRVGAFFTSGNCHATLYDWINALLDPDNEVAPKYDRFNIPANEYRKPRTLEEAHLAPSQVGSDTGVYGAWKAQFEAWLDYMDTYHFPDTNIVWFSDREAKGLVNNQYSLTSPPVTVDETRLRKIVEFLVNIDNWQSVNEWNLVDPVLVRRPSNYVNIIVNSENEYYSLSEAYWHILSALKDIENTSSITYQTLDPVIGPYEPDVCSETTAPDVPEQDSVYRVFAWWQHYTGSEPTISYQKVLEIAPSLFSKAQTDLIGPTFPDSSRRRNLKKVVTFWNLTDINGNPVNTNAAEMLYLLAKALYYYYNPTSSDTFTFLPSHVLPKGYYTFLLNGRFKPIFGTENQLNWLDIGQRWTLKPAVLKSQYR